MSNLRSLLAEARKVDAETQPDWGIRARTLLPQLAEACAPLLDLNLDAIEHIARDGFCQRCDGVGSVATACPDERLGCAVAHSKKCPKCQGAKWTPAALELARVVEVLRAALAPREHGEGHDGK